MIDFKDYENDIYINNIYDITIQEKQHIYIDISKNTNKEKQNIDYVLENYCNYKNYIASFVEKRKCNYCFNIFLDIFKKYKSKNINIEYNKIKEKIDFIKDVNNKKIILNNFEYIDSNLYNIFNLIKNNKF